MSQQGTVIAKYSRGSDTFEIFVNAEKAHEFISGKRANALDALEVEQVFKDANKGDRQSDEKINKVFGTKDLEKVVAVILKNGHVPMTTEQRHRITEEKRKQVIEIIARNSIDPRTGAPNPPMRIENAMKEGRVQIDPFKSASEQIDDVVKKINMIMPIKFAIAKIDVTIPAEYANRCYGSLKKIGIKSEQWLSNGSLNVTMEFPAGLKNEIFDKINSMTQGNAVIKVVQ